MQYLSQRHYENWYEYHLDKKHLPVLPYIETMVTHGCTLACEGCTNYSDYGMTGGNVSWDEHFEDLKVLTNRFNIECYGFIGGEPFLHNKFKDWVVNFKEEFPYITLMIVTNAQLFPKNADWFLDCMEKYGMIYLKFSNHIPGADYFEESKQLVLDRFNWEQVDELKWFNQEPILDFLIDDNDTFLKSSKGKYGDMKPYHNDPIEAFDICSQQTCPLFYQGKLHKCSTVGMLDKMLADHDQHDDPDWAPYINAGVDIRTATDERIKQFADNHGKPHMELCKMCPTKNDNAYFKHFPLVVNKLGFE